MLVTVGAYGALFTAFQALVDEGDEVNGQSPGWVGVKGPVVSAPAHLDLCTRLSSPSLFLTCYEPMTLMQVNASVFVSLKPVRMLVGVGGVGQRGPRSVLG